MYSDLESQSQLFELNLKLREIRQGEDSITKYFNSVKKIWQDLDLFDTYEWQLIEDGKHHKRTIEKTQIYKFLAGLNIEFDEVKGRIIGRNPLPPIGEVFLEVRLEESRRSVMLGKKVLRTIVEGSSLATMGEGYGRNTNYSPKSNEKPWVWCDFYNKPCHTCETYWKIHGN
uniref:Retrotransposon gag domain-containing protein n=1 Tax=Cannabis sativa TaxID=3483 RepID=A0A803NGJ7_CANSA